MAKVIYGIEEFGSNGIFWRVVWFGGIRRSSLVPSEPQIQVLLASVPKGEPDPLSRSSCQSSLTQQVWIGVGQLPYLSIGSIWQNTKPIRNRLIERHEEKLVLDTTSVRFVSLGDLVMKHGAIPKSHYLFAGNFAHAAKTLIAAIRVEDDPWAVLIPAIELIRFYYASSTRLAQALFWGSYHESVNSEKCGQLPDGPYRVHLRNWIADTDAWVLARFCASGYMRQQVLTLYQGIQKYYADSWSINPTPFCALKCGFPFAGETTLEAVTLSLPGPTYEFRRILILKLLRCTAPFPFDDLLCDRDNQNLRGKEAGEENLQPAWIQHVRKEDEEEQKNRSDDPAKKNFHSDGEPSKHIKPLVVDIRENRFADLDGKKLIKEPPEVQKYRSATALNASVGPLEGFGTGEGIWGAAEHKPAQINTNVSPPVPTLPVSLNLFFAAITKLANEKTFTVRYVAQIDDELGTSETPILLDFPMGDPGNAKKFTWAIFRQGPKRFRARHVVVVEVGIEGRTCYVLEAERLRSSETISVLVIARKNLALLTGKELLSVLIDSAHKRAWMSKSEMPDYLRKTTTHKGLVDAGVLTRRIKEKVLAILRAEAALTDGISVESVPVGVTRDTNGPDHNPVHQMSAGGSPPQVKPLCL